MPSGHANLHIPLVVPVLEVAILILRRRCVFITCLAPSDLLLFAVHAARNPLANMDMIPGEDKSDTRES